jgi:hypothetical protein
MHAYVVAVLFLLSLAAPIVVKMTAASATPFNQMLQAAEAAQATGDIYSSGVKKLTFYGKQSMRSLQLTAYLKQWPDDPDAEAGKFAGILLQTFGGDTDVDQVSIMLVHGYDIGIASAWRSQAINKAPGDWPQPTGP